MFAALTAMLFTLPGGAAAQRALGTSVIQDPLLHADRTYSNAAFANARAAGARYVKFLVRWSYLAPLARPAGFNAGDPLDPNYRWAVLDDNVRLAKQQGLDPILTILEAPSWASAGDGWTRPDPDELALFARAVATRYSGRFVPVPAAPFAEALPRVRYWQVWNEPNLYYYFRPQFNGGRLESASLYRAMVNKFSDAIHAVNSSNLVIAGGTGPFARQLNSAPLVFMRELLCLRTDLRVKPNCGPVRFDIWGHHPYTSGGPTHHALARNDVSLGDLPEMKRVLTAAVRRGRIRSALSVRFWVDEFSWDTRPPDPRGVPSRLHARWVAEAFYRMWKLGITHVSWLQIADNRWTGVCGDIVQSGLYFYAPNLATARPKYSLRAFRFPFVALRENGRLVLWGRTPTSRGARVTIQRKLGARWRAITRVRAGGNGVFRKRLARPWRTGRMRAKIGRTTSLPFALTGPPDRFFNAFGTLPRPGQCG
jgi:hypothetical protein